MSVKMECTHCDVITDLSDIHKQCKIYMARNRPVLFKGAAKQWPCAGKWNMDFFREGAMGDTMINVSLDGKEKGPKAEMSLRDYIASFSSGQSGAAGAHDAATGGNMQHQHFKPYMRAWFFSEDHPQLEQDFPNPPPYFPDKFKGVDKSLQPPFTWIFIGPQGAYSPLHRDIWFTCAWMAQLQGRKRFVFFPPADLSYVYQKNEDKSEVYLDLTNPQLQLFPDFQKAAAIECVLEEGDVVYIPSRWPHFVECLTPSVSLTSNFANVANFKHVLVPYTRWLERRRLTMALVAKMKEAAAGNRLGAASSEDSAQHLRGSTATDLQAEQAEEEGSEEDEEARESNRL